jgi:hypothetical protein
MEPVINWHDLTLQFDGHESTAIIQMQLVTMKEKEEIASTSTNSPSEPENDFVENCESHNSAGPKVRDDKTPAEKRVRFSDAEPKVPFR